MATVQGKNILGKHIGVKRTHEAQSRSNLHGDPCAILLELNGLGKGKQHRAIDRHPSLISVRADGQNTGAEENELKRLGGVGGGILGNKQGGASS